MASGRACLAMASPVFHAMFFGPQWHKEVGKCCRDEGAKRGVFGVFFAWRGPKPTILCRLPKSPV